MSNFSIRKTSTWSLKGADADGLTLKRQDLQHLIHTLVFLRDHPSFMAEVRFCAVGAGSFSVSIYMNGDIVARLCQFRGDGSLAGRLSLPASALPDLVTTLEAEILDKGGLADAI